MLPNTMPATMKGPIICPFAQAGLVDSHPASLDHCATAVTAPTRTTSTRSSELSTLLLRSSTPSNTAEGRTTKCSTKTFRLLLAHDISAYLLLDISLNACPVSCTK